VRWNGCTSQAHSVSSVLKGKGERLVPDFSVHRDGGRRAGGRLPRLVTSSIVDWRARDPE
jgi:hypothetical protein